MPLIKSRSKHTKVFRPNGTRWSEGRAISFQEAVGKAIANFWLEFHQMPKQETMVIELVGTSSDWIAQLFEVIEPKEDFHGDIHPDLGQEQDDL